MTSARLDDKLFATLQAKAALVGISLVRSTDDQGREIFIMSKWAMTRELPSATDVERLLERIGGARA